MPSVAHFDVELMVVWSRTKEQWHANALSQYSHVVFFQAASPLPLNASMGLGQFLCIVTRTPLYTEHRETGVLHLGLAPPPA